MSYRGTSNTKTIPERLDELEQRVARLEILMVQLKEWTTQAESLAKTHGDAIVEIMKILKERL